jgi:TetR/AcrR family transcriptional regulator
VSQGGRGRDTREKLLEVAQKEFARYGYAGAHLQSIAEQIGVQKTALYYYFDGKSALYTAVLQTMLEDFGRMFEEAARPDGSYRERLTAMVASFNDLMAERPNYARILIRIFIDPVGVDYDTVAPVIQRVIGDLLLFHREGVKAGEFAPRSARHFFQSFFGMSLFHYAAPEFSRAVLGVDDVYSDSARTWRRDEVTSLLFEGVLPRSEDSDPEAR